MFFKSKTNPEKRYQIPTALGPLAWMAFIMSVILDRLEYPDLDFLSGTFVGFAIIGNLLYIFIVTRNLHINRRLK